MTGPTDQPYDYDGAGATDTRRGLRGEVVSLSEYGAMLRRRWRAITACALIGLLAAAGAYKITPNTYEARALVSLSPLPSQATTSTNRNDVNTSTETGIAKSTRVADDARKEMAKTYSNYNDLRPGQVSSNLTVSVPTGALVLEFRYRAKRGKGDEAAAGANAFANAYLNYRRDRATAYAQTMIEAISGLRNQRQDDLRKIERQIADTSTSKVQLDSLKVQRTNALGNLSDLEAEEDAAKSLSTNPGTVVDEARRPGGPSAPSLPLYAAAGLILGLLAGLAYALHREHSDDHVRGTGDLVRAGADPLLASIKVPRRMVAGASLSLLSAPEGPEAEGYRLLAAKLMSVTATGSRSLLVSGAGGGDPRVATNLAIALARSGKSVLLWSAPHSLTSNFGALGLTDAALPVPGAAGTIVSLSALPGLTLAPLREDTLPTIGSTSSAAEVDFVLIDDSVGAALWRTVTLAGHVDGVLLVANVGGRGRKALRELIGELRSIDATVLGGVMLVGSRVAAPPAVPRTGPAPSGAGVRSAAPTPARTSPTPPTQSQGPATAEPSSLSRSTASPATVLPGGTAPGGNGARPAVDEAGGPAGDTTTRA